MEKEEEKRNAIEQAKKKAEAEIRAFQSEIHDLEARLSKSEQTRIDKEHQTRMMQDELDQQEDLVTRYVRDFYIIIYIYNVKIAEILLSPIFREANVLITQCTMLQKFSKMLS